MMQVNSGGGNNKACDVADVYDCDLSRSSLFQTDWRFDPCYEVSYMDMSCFY